MHLVLSEGDHMQRYAMAAGVFLLASLPALAQESANLHRLERRIHREGEKSLPYRLLIPKGYKPGNAWPLIVWLHGSGEKGTDNVSQVQPIERTFLADPEKCPAFVMVPQCPSNTAWHAVGFNKPAEMPEPARMIVATVAELQKEFGLDDRRLYIGGFSMGGCGTWDMLSRCPDLFAAAFPIAGPPGDREALAPVIKHVPIWAFHGDRDRVAPIEGTRSIVAALKAAGAEVRYTEFPGGGHECDNALADPKLTEWLLAQKRTSSPSYAPVPVPLSAALIIKTLPDGARDTWTGTAELTGRGAARLLIGNVRYRLKPAASASPSVAEVLAKIGKAEIAEKCQVTGTVELTDYAWLVVERIEVVK